MKCILMLATICAFFVGASAQLKSQVSLPDYSALVDEYGLKDCHILVPDLGQHAKNVMNNLVQLKDMKSKCHSKIHISYLKALLNLCL